ncbi:MAG: DMT family transporter [Planctomycetota bacterium]
MASVVFVAGLIGMQRAQVGLTVLTTIFANNISTAIAFSAFWMLGGSSVPTALWWQPIFLAALFVVGILLTFAAVQLGDVSVATPVLGLKVLIVACVMTIWLGERLPVFIWVSAILAALGVALIQWTDQGQPKRLWLTIAMALGAATCYAHFDIAIQQWSAQWSTGRLMPMIGWCVGVLSLPLLPWVQFRDMTHPSIRPWLILGCFATTMQACLIISTLSWYGDAARVNIVFSLRGIWALGLAWAAARVWGGHEAELSRRVIVRRFSGATLLTVAVILAISA